MRFCWIFSQWALRACIFSWIEGMKVRCLIQWVHVKSCCILYIVLDVVSAYCTRSKVYWLGASLSPIKISFNIEQSMFTYPPICRFSSDGNFNRNGISWGLSAKLPVTTYLKGQFATCKQFTEKLSVTTCPKSRHFTITSVTSFISSVYHLFTQNDVIMYFFKWRHNVVFFL